MDQKYCKLLVLSTHIEGSRRLALCLCDCGNTKSYRVDLLKDGRRKSCGCINSPNEKDYLINLRKRLLKNSKRKGDCLEWIGRFNANGYGFLPVRINGKKTGTNAHRASYLAWIGKVPEGLFVLHKCDNRKCIEPTHLFLGTHLENMKDMISKGRQFRPIGETHRNSKFTNIEILKIREEYSIGNISQNALSKKYACSLSCMHNIVMRKCWKHL